MLCPFWIWSSFRFQGGWVLIHPLSMFLAHSGSELMGFGNLLYICKYEDRCTVLFKNAQCEGYCIAMTCKNLKKKNAGGS